MELIDKIKNLKREQLDIIVSARRATPLVSFLSVNGKARAACIQRHKGWADLLLSYTNASIEACVRNKLGNAVTTAAIISSFESMGLGLIAREDLTLEEYNLIISPVVSSFPELIFKEQSWTPVPLEGNLRLTPRMQYQLPPEVSRTEATTIRKARAFRRKEDYETDIKESGIDASDIMAALKPKKKETIALSPDDVLKTMLEAMKPKESIPVITADYNATTGEYTPTDKDSPPKPEPELTPLQIMMNAMKKK